jgi:hypothetical protein
MSVFFAPISSAATTYTINLTVLEEASALNIALYDDEGQSISDGVKKCKSKEISWINHNATSKYDLVKSTKIGNQTKVKIKNDSSKIVGLGTLSTVIWRYDRSEVDDNPDIGTIVYGTCIYSQKIKVTLSDFYSIELVGVATEPFDISLADLKKKKWKLTLTI